MEGQNTMKQQFQMTKCDGADGKSYNTLDYKSKNMLVYACIHTKVIYCTICVYVIVVDQRCNDASEQKSHQLFYQLECCVYVTQKEGIGELFLGYKEWLLHRA